MKNFLLYIWAIISIFIIILLVLSEKNNDDIIFEMGHNPDVVYNQLGEKKNWDSYFALKSDNILIWVYGKGELSKGSFGSYFNSIKEKGYIKLTNEEVFEIKQLLNSVVKPYDPVESDYNKYLRDSSEWIIKYKSKYYNYNSDINYSKYNDDISFSTFEDKIIDIINNYQETYKDNSEDIAFDVGGSVLYDYTRLQE